MTLPFDKLVTTTLEKRLQGLEDVVFQGRPFSKWLLDKGRVQTYEGGRHINVPLELAENATFQTYAGYTTLDVAPQDPFSMAQYEWRNAAISVAISGEEEAKNNGKAGVIKLVDALTSNAKESAIANFNRMWLTGAGTGTGWNSLTNLIVASGTVGGIATADVASWNSVRTANASISLAELNLFYTQTSKGNMRPDFELTTETLLSAYESALAPQLRYTNNTMAEAGFENLKHKTATVFCDFDVTAGEWYLLNSKALYLFKHSQDWMKVGPFIKPADQDAKFSLIISRGNLAVSNRRLLACWTGASAVTV
jgi:hypothetical protein